MKLIFFFLLLLNTVFFIWAITVQNRLGLWGDSIARLEINSGKGNIILVKELGELPGSGNIDQTDLKFAVLSRLPSFYEYKENTSNISTQVTAKSISNALSFATSQMLEKELSKTQQASGGGAMLENVRRHVEDSRLNKFKLSLQKEPVCYKVGPSLTRRALTPLLDYIRSTGRPAELRLGQDDKVNGYMVFYPPADDYEASRQEVKRLKSSGVKDLWLVNQGSRRGAISLGVFDSRDRAEIRKKQLAVKGIPAQIAPRLSKRRVYFVFFPWSESAAKLEQRVRTTTSQGERLQRAGWEFCP